MGSEPATTTTRRWPRRFGLKALLLLPVAAALALLAVDRWTATPARITPMMFRVLDSETGRPVTVTQFGVIDKRVGNVKLGVRGNLYFMRHGGRSWGSGTSSLLRDTRRPDADRLRLSVSALDYEPIDVPVSSLMAGLVTRAGRSSETGGLVGPGEVYYEVPVPMRRQTSFPGLRK